MLNHITIKVSDAQKSKAFYKQALAPLGYDVFLQDDTTVGFGLKDVEGHSAFWIRQASLPSEKSISCIAFNANDKETVDAFYKEALAAGGEDNGGPGYRPQYHAGYYAAFVLDPDGYNIEALFDDWDKLTG